MSSTDSADTDFLSIKVMSPAGVHLEAKAQSFTAVNNTGEFDVLPGHRNFITLLSSCTIKVHGAQTAVKDIDITSGIFHLENNEIKVFLNILPNQ